jgi:hypothetical protein
MLLKAVRALADLYAKPGNATYRVGPDAYPDTFRFGGVGFGGAGGPKKGK